MKNLIGFTLAITSMLFVACGNPTTEATTNDTSAKMVTDTMTSDMMSTKTYDVSLVNNKKILHVVCQLRQEYQIQHIMKNMY